MIEAERYSMELTGDSMDLKPITTRKLRRRANESASENQYTHIYLIFRHLNFAEMKSSILDFLSSKNGESKATYEGKMQPPRVGDPTFVMRQIIYQAK